MDSSRGWFHGVRHLVFGLIALAAFVPASAWAACTNPNGNGITWYCADEGEAYAKAHTLPPKYPGLNPGPIIVQRASSGFTYNARHQYPNGEVISAGSASWLEGQECSTRQPLTGLYQDGDPNTSDAVCDNGCLMDSVLVIEPDGSSETQWQATGAVCTETDAPPPQADADGDGVPDDTDAFPNDPNESADTDGDGTGDNEDFAPEDPTDGVDDGTGDETDNQAGGGGTCGAPPSCSGDGIACATLYQQWETRCAIDRLAAGLNGDGSQGDGGGDEEDDNPWGEGDGSTPSFNVQNVDSQLLDTSGFMGGGSCPTWGPIEILGVSYPLPQVHCDILEWIGFLVVAVALVVAARILGS